MSALSVRDLVVRYGDVTAVDGISFDVPEGTFVSLLGPSGCGKTTTLRCVAGLESLVGGEIRIGSDVVATHGRETPPERRGVNMVFQSYAVWPHMSVFDNVAYGLRMRGLTRAEITRRVNEALLLVGLDAFAARFGTELSGGQQQRVAVARAIVTEPRLLLFDEPLSNLDAGLRERMRFDLLALQRRLGRTSLYVTHDQAEAMLMSDRIILMNAGRIVQDSTPRDLYERPVSRFAAAFVGNANLLPVHISADHGDGRWTVGLSDGTSLAAVQATPTWRPPPSGEALVCIRPENIAPGPGENAFDATLARVSYLGATLNCELDRGAIGLRADLSARTSVQEGARMQFNIPKDCVILIDTD